MSTRHIDREAVRQVIAEEAAYWDTTDTADLMEQETEWLTFKPSSRYDRCGHCGAKMQPRQVDLRLSGGRVILRRVTQYVCFTPGCKQTRLFPAAAALADQIEALVRRTAVGVDEMLASPWAQTAQVRESDAEYMTGETGQS
ncbi:MAG: hypothetical protein CVU38_01430 [Chloroflexi bacterium HGW-Chloroflexi-1]|nr:MAG: hypothetical protein CVU38_01430 [Chloroflexi bacterium HGW-Chloroflexi-1]